MAPVFCVAPLFLSQVENGTGAIFKGGIRSKFRLGLTLLMCMYIYVNFCLLAQLANGLPRKNTVAYELKHWLTDNTGNEYPEEDKVFLTCNKTGKSNGELTISILNNVIFPIIGINDGLRRIVLVDDFKGHSKKEVKDFVKSKQSGNDSMSDDERYDLCQFEIMAGRITPEGQPINAFIGKDFKGYYREHHPDLTWNQKIDEVSVSLAPYIKFGCVSIREVYWIFKNNLGGGNGLVKQLYWRDFYYNILYHFPETYTKKRGLKSVYAKFPWSHDKIKFKPQVINTGNKLFIFIKICLLLVETLIRLKSKNVKKKTNT